MTFLLAHLSDIHLSPIRGLGPRHANIKRALGLANWLLKRRHVHLPQITAALVADLHRHKPDHIAVTGDLVNLGLPGEMDYATRWLEALGPPDGVTLVPGNHDIYVRLHTDHGVERWRPYMQGEENGDHGGFPYLRRVGPLALIGLNSALPRAPFYASGRLGSAQLATLARLLDNTWAEGLARIVLIHHPPLPGQSDARRGLEDAAALEQVIREHGAELILHGHNHCDMLERRETRTGDALSIGVASASIGKRHKHEPLGRYNFYRFDPVPGGLRIELHGRGFAEPEGPVVEIERRELATVKLSNRASSMP